MQPLSLLNTTRRPEDPRTHRLDPKPYKPLKPTQTLPNRQEFMILPVGASSFREAIQIGAEARRSWVWGYGVRMV